MSVEHSEGQVENFKHYDHTVVEQYLGNLSLHSTPENFYIIEPEQIGVSHNGMEHEFDPLNLPDGLHFAADFMERVYGLVDSVTPDEVRFVPEERHLMRLGKEDSVRKVFFGNLRLSWSSGMKAKISAPVAVKPFTSNTYRAYNEFAMTDYIRSLGIDTFMPIMIHKEKNATYLVTLYDPSVTTFDNTPWHHPDSDRRESVAICDQLSVCANHLAKLHANMVIHRDPQVKNIGHREDVKSDVAVDLETAVSIKDADLSDSFIQKLLVGEHLFFFQSLMRNGYAHGFDLDERFMHYLEHFFEPYQQTLLNNAPDYARLFFIKGLEESMDEIMSFSVSAYEAENTDVISLGRSGIVDSGRELRTIPFANNNYS